MANEEQLTILNRGKEAWNAWRAEHPEAPIDLGEADLAGAKLDDCDLNGANLERADVTGALARAVNLSNANLKGLRAEGTKFTYRANLRGADLGEAVLREADLFGADMRDANLSGARLENALLVQAKLQEANLTNARCERTLFTDGDLRGANLAGASLDRAVFTRADMREARLDHASLADANMSQTDLSGATLFQASGHGASFTSAVLRNASLDGSSFQSAIFHRTDLRDAKARDVWFSGATISESDLRRADLSDAKLHSAFIGRSDLKGAHLAGAQVGETSFSACYLDDCTGLDRLRRQSDYSVDAHTVARSGAIPERFLIDAGWPREIVDVQSLFTGKPIKLHERCFISYSSRDTELADELYDRLRRANVDAFYAPDDLPWGAKTREHIVQEIYLRSRLVLLVTENSVASEWVEDEVNTARRKEKETGETVLLPIFFDESAHDPTNAWAFHLWEKRAFGDFRSWTDPTNRDDLVAKLLDQLEED